MGNTTVTPLNNKKSPPRKKRTRQPTSQSTPSKFRMSNNESTLNLLTLVKNRRWDDVLSQNVETLSLDFFSRTPVHWACTLNPPVEVIEHLLNGNNEAVLIQDSSGGYTPLHLASLHDASFPVISSLLSRCPSAASIVDKLGWTPLHHASFNCSSINVITKLVETYPYACEIATRNNGSTCLHLACRRGVCVSVIRKILEANSRAVTLTMRHGWTPLHLCIWNNASYGVLRAILEADPTTVLIRNKMGVTPIVSLWKECYADDEARRDGSGDNGSITAITETRDSENWKKINILLYASYFGTLTNFDSERGWSIIHAVLSCPDDLPGLLNLVLRIQPDAAKCVDKNGWLPLHFACCCPKIKTRDFQALVQTFPSAAAVLGPTGRYPLMLAIENRKTWSDGLRSLFYAFPEVLQIKDKLSGMYPFMMAAIGDHSSLTTIHELILCCPEMVRSQHCI